jgi:signal transduction histidine kinase
VKGVAEAHGGEIQIESTENKGTKFTLKLPIKTGKMLKSA